MYVKLLGLISASTLPYLFSLSGDFVFDDSEAIVKNKDVLSDSWTDAFSNDFWGTNIKSNLSHKSYRPLTIMSFRMNYILNGKQLAATHFKVTNLVTHVVCCILVWKTFQSLLKNVGFEKNKKWQADVAYLAALLFAVHPVHVEAICGIVGRADILAGVSFFSAILFYTKCMENNKFKYLYLFGTILMATFSMLFKENGITVLGFCVSYEIVTMFKLKNAKVTIPVSNKKYQNHKESFIRIAIMMLAVILLLHGRWTIMGGTKPVFKPIDNPAAFSNSTFTKIATYNYIYFINILLFLWPQWLCYDWSMGCISLVDNILDYRILFIILLYVYGIIFLKAIITRRNKESFKRLIVLAALLIIIPFLPAANIFYPVGFVIAERILYISSAGYCLLITTGLHKIIITQKNRTHKIHIILFSLLIIIYASRSWQRSFEWQNEYMLFVSGLSVCPHNAKIHYNVAKVADRHQRTVWAFQEYKESLRLYPEYYQAMNNLANLFKNNEQFEKAEFYLKKALNLKSDFPAAWMNLGIVLASTRRYEESESAYRSALTYRKNYPDCLYNLGNLYLEMNKTENAMESWIQAINLNSTHVLAWTNLLALLDNTGQIQKALSMIPKAIAELPNAPSINFAIGNIYGKLDRYEEAEQHFRKAIRLFGNKVQAIHFANLGVLYHRWKKYGLAEDMYKNALKIDPLFRSAHKNLKSLKKINSVH